MKKKYILFIALLIAFMCSRSKKDIINNYIEDIAKTAQIGNHAETIYRKCIFLKSRKQGITDTNFIVILRDRIMPEYNKFLEEASAKSKNIKMPELKELHGFYISGIKYMSNTFPLMIQSFEIQDEKERAKLIDKINENIKKSTESFKIWSTRLVKLGANNMITKNEIEQRISKNIKKDQDYMKKPFTEDDLLRELKLK